MRVAHILRCSSRRTGLTTHAFSAALTGCRLDVRVYAILLMPAYLRSITFVLPYSVNVGILGYAVTGPFSSRRFLIPPSLPVLPQQPSTPALASHDLSPARTPIKRLTDKCPNSQSPDKHNHFLLRSCLLRCPQRDLH